MTQYFSWIFASLIVAGLGYGWYHDRRKTAEKEMRVLRANRAAFLAEKQRKWPDFYKKYNQLSDEEILTRYMFVVVGEILGPPRFEGWSFQSFSQYPPQRDEILDAIAEDGPLNKEQIYALAAKIDPEGHAAYAQYPLGRSGEIT